MPAETCRTERFFDGTYWDAAPPEGWTFRQDKTVRGYPYTFEKASARLRIWAGKHVNMNYGHGVTRPDIASEAVRKAYVSALSDARLSRMYTWTGFAANVWRSLPSYDSELQRHDLGDLCGFTYRRDRDDDAWRGHFASRGDWSLHVAFSAAGGAADPLSREALAILASLRFKHED